MLKQFRFVGALVLGLVLLSGCSNAKDSESVFSAASQCGSQTLSHRYIAHWEDGSFTLETGSSDEEFRKDFVDKNLAKLIRVDRDARIRIDIQKSAESIAENATTNINWGPEKVEAPALWQQDIRGQNIIVGVVDGMVDDSHDQLKNNIISVQQFNSEVNDPIHNKHGTHVAGIIAADPNEGPVFGVAPRAKILGGQFIGNDGAGSLGDAILAMNSVAKKGAKIINMSWGGAPCVQNLESALRQLSQQGVLLVTAAGNEGLNSDQSPTYPAAFGFANQINVGASTIDDFMIYFSNRGVRTVNVVAPGVGIYSTVPGNAIEAMDGTSMAAPLVAGSAALIWSAEPSATAQQVKLALLKSVDIPSNRDFQVSSRGRLNARKALDELRKLISSK